MPPESPPPKDMPSLSGLLLDALKQSHARRPLSFYMLLAIPVVLILGAPLLNYREQPKRAIIVLSVLFIFFGVVLARAVSDIFQITRGHWAESRQTFRETLGNDEFLSELNAKRNAPAGDEDATSGHPEKDNNENGTS